MPTRPVSSCFVLICLFLATLLPVRAAHAERYAALVVDADSGRVLFERNAHEQRYPASLTKMMTLYLLFEALQQGRVGLQSRLPVSANAAAKPPTNLNLKPGDTISVETAIRALVVRSANDVATVIAEALGQTEFQFAAMMTQKARALGMTRTRFRNASGLPDEDQVSTAWDLYLLAKALMRDFPQYYAYFNTRAFSHQGAHYQTHNRLLLNYPGADGLKTGYIRASGFNLVTSARRDGQRLIAVVLGGNTARQRDAHMRNLLDAGFASLQGATPALQLVSLTRPAAAAVAEDEPTPREQGSAAGRSAGKAANPAGRWAVQVGTFASRRDAESRARQALRVAPTPLEGAVVGVSSARSGGKTVYRARLGGLERDDAQSACRVLKQKRFDCLSVPPGG
ncbi:MAG TPA: D-alanyl-D-alanine carboxypeptidase [Candidatus Competibacteraceae bacterium]|nr:D-alanyl-D-alanine carboxypeptidase [Candidatus Competibacteraceae bacterium]